MIDPALILIYHDDQNGEEFMVFPKEVIFRFSKIKIFLLLCVCVAFMVSGGYILFSNPAEIESGIRGYSSVTAYWLVSIALIIPAVVAFICIRKLSTKNLGLVLGKDGFIHNTKGYSLGFVPWSDVTEVTENEAIEYSLEGEKVILIKLRNPEVYFDQENIFMKHFLEKAMKKYGTPLSVSAISLNSQHDKLLGIIQAYFQGYRENII